MTNPKTNVRTPTMGVSDEADEQQLQLAREQGSAFGRALEHMTQTEARGAELRAGDYLIGYAVEEAEGMYALEEGELVWHNPTDENVHVEVVVRDGGDGRFVPALTVHATLVDSNGKEIGTYLQPFLWHPWLYHYGRNWQVPGAGEYTLRVRVDPPEYMRHDKVNGRRFAYPVQVEFRGVKITPGQKKS
jgi:hypothetical protein